MWVSQDNPTLARRQGKWVVKPRKQQRHPKAFFGLDAETYQGWARLVCVEPARGGPGMTFHLGQDREAAPRWLQALTNHNALRGSCFVSYNMRFDAESLIKHLEPWLGLHGLQRLATLGMTEFVIKFQGVENRWRLKYIPTKVLRIAASGSRGSHNAVSLYDIAQFYPGLSLEKASTKYLGEHKDKGVDSTRLNTDLAYWREHEEAIGRYCRQDARLCARLAEFMAGKVRELWNVDFKSPYSPAQTSQKIFLSRSGVMHPIHRLDVAQAVYNSYYGGRIECRIRGQLEEACLVDMKSAYVWAMVDLPDTKGRWHYTKGPSKALDMANVPYAFVKARVETSCQPDEWGPLPVRTKEGLLVYPQGTLEGWWPWPEVCHARELGLLSKVQVQRTIWLEPDDDNTQPFLYLQDIFRQKEQEKDEARKHVIKTCALGMYGKTAQCVEVLRKASSQPRAAAVARETNGNGEYFVHGVPVRRVLEPGYLFNPAVASYVTSRVRMKLLDKVCALNGRGAAVFTDSVILEGRAHDHDKNLGGWDSKPEKGTCRILMTGMYQFQGQAPKVRGLPIRGLKDWDYFKLHGARSIVTRKGPMHLHGALRRNQFRLVNQWVERRKVLGPNSDQKRRWPHWRSFDSLFSKAWVGALL